MDGKLRLLEKAMPTQIMFPRVNAISMIEQKDDRFHVYRANHTAL